MFARIKKYLPKIRKALVGAGLPALVLLIDALGDGVLDSGELLAALGAALGSGLVVWRVPNDLRDAIAKARVIVVEDPAQVPVEPE